MSEHDELRRQLDTGMNRIGESIAAEMPDSLETARDAAPTRLRELTPTEGPLPEPLATLASNPEEGDQ